MNICCNEKEQRFSAIPGTMIVYCCSSQFIIIITSHTMSALYTKLSLFKPVYFIEKPGSGLMYMLKTKRTV